MELYHLHTKGIKDEKWKVKKEIHVTDKFNNRLAKKINNFTTATDEKGIEDLAMISNSILYYNGYQIPKCNNIEDLMSCYLSFEKENPELKKCVLELIKKSCDILRKASVFKRELAMEEYRKNHNPNLPSRMHCIYALEEKDIETWSNILIDNDLEVFRIDALEYVFKTSEQLIPAENLSYKEFYDASRDYWNPKKLDVNCEYLIKGRVKVLEKVDEIKHI